MNMSSSEKRKEVVYHKCSHQWVPSLSLAGSCLHGYTWPATWKKNVTAIKLQDLSTLSTSSVNVAVIHLRTSAIIRFSPITPHPPGKIITALLSLHKDDCFVLFFSHYLLHQLKKSVDGERQLQPISSVSSVWKDNHMFCHTLTAHEITMTCYFSSGVFLLVILTFGLFQSPCRRRQSAGCCGWRWAPGHQC